MENAARKPNEAVEFPSLWLDEKRLIVATSQKVLMRNIETGNEVVAFEAPIERQTREFLPSKGCFSEKQWHIPIGFFEAKTGYYPREAYVALVDGGDIIEWYRGKSGGGYWDRNYFDCEYIDSSKIKARPAQNPRPNSAIIEVKEARGLFSRQHAQNVFVGAAFGTAVIEYSLGGKEFRLELMSTKTSEWTTNRIPRPIMDSATPSGDGETPAYYVLGATRNDVGSVLSWPKTLWKLGLENGDLFTLQLPPGPWVGDHKDRWQCFSGGCSMYRRMKVFISKEILFAHIFGIGFPSEVQGVWSINLSQLSKGWRHVVPGVFSEPIAISPSGCQIAFALSETEVRNVCN